MKSNDVELVPLVVDFEGGLTPSQLESAQEISYEEFVSEYADQSASTTVDGEDDTTVYSGQMNGWFLAKST